MFGYFGEHIAFELGRISHWLEDVKNPIANEICDIDMPANSI